MEGTSRSALDLGVEEVLTETERLGLLLTVRLAMAAIVMVVGSLEDSPDLVLVAAVYAASTTAVELARRRRYLRADGIVVALYLVDGAFLALAVARTGGLGSPLETLFFLHVVTVILVSGRSLGVQVACWDAGLLGGLWVFGSVGQEGASILGLAVREATLLITAAVTSGVVALHQRRLEAAVRRLTDRDPLTGLANRRGLDQALRQEVARAQRTGGDLVVAVVDLDRFKHVNDTRGHQAGDQVLVQVAGALSDGVREYDLAARLGGDEFVLVLPGCASEQAVAVAERLRRSIARSVTVADGVTATIGVAAYGRHGTDPEELVRAADHALYEGKREGRDRTVAAIDPDPRIALLEPGA